MKITRTQGTDVRKSTLINDNNRGRGYNRRPCFCTRYDDRIESSVKNSHVFRACFKSADINIQSKDGVVTLTGTVCDEACKALARETVASIPGVKSVDDQLQVKDEVPVSNHF